MPGTTSIEWATHVWNPVTGCSKVSEGCRFCYALSQARRNRGRNGYPPDNPFRPAFHPDRLEQPRRWRPAVIFVNSMSDLFHEDFGDDIVQQVWDVMRRVDRHVYIVLTKRAERLAALAPKLEFPPHICIGVSAEDQHWADRRIPRLLSVPAATRLVSCEPLLGPIDLTPYFRCPHCRGNGAGCHPCAGTGRGLDWVIVGGESGPKPRPMKPDWVRAIRDSCQTHGVPFFFKQWGRRNKKASGRLLDDREWNERPAVIQHLLDRRALKQVRQAPSETDRAAGSCSRGRGKRSS